MGGETLRHPLPDPRHEGLPPRGRGNPAHGGRGRQHERSTPAWAGKPGTTAEACNPREVYPRVGGETGGDSPCTGGRSGLPPRGRGNQANVSWKFSQTRSTPAWAGKPREKPRLRCDDAVYPRVGGETLAVVMEDRLRAGLPPRGRGNPRRTEPATPLQGSTPAWAGKPIRWSVRQGGTGVYPRVGGETLNVKDATGHFPGLPPRGRGNRPPDANGALAEGSTPAWAGKPLLKGSRLTLDGVYPRVGGETFRSFLSSGFDRGLPPRGRGNQGVGGSGRRGQRSTPAWAGKPHRDRMGTTRQGVYPRVGGETSPVITSTVPMRGLPPRGRGNHGDFFDVGSLRGSTPAWAGKPLQYRVK